MLSTTSRYASTTTPDDYLAQVVPAPRRVVALATPAFTAPTTPEAEGVGARFWWMPIADTAPDPDSPIFDQLMFEVLAGEL